MPNLDPVVFLSPSAIGTAIEVTVASLASPTELNSRAASQGELIITRTIAAGTDDCVIYYADTTSDAESLPYIVGNLTAGVKFVAIAGRYRNATQAISSLTASRITTTDASKNLATPLTISVDQTITTTGTVASKATGAAGIALDKDSATGDFTMSLSPANLTANRRTTFGDGTFSFTGGGTLALGGFTLTVPATGTAGLLGTAQTWSAANVFSSTVELNTSSNGLTISKTTGTTLTVSSGTDSNSSITGCAVLSGGMGMSGGLFSWVTFNGAGLRANFRNNGTGNAYSELGCEQDASNYFKLYYFNSTYSSSGAYQAASALFEQTGGAGGLGFWLRSGGPLKVYDGAAAVTLQLSNAGDLTLAKTTGTTLTVSSTDAASVALSGGILLDGATTKTIKYTNGTANGSVATTLGSVGPTGSTAGDPQGWLRVNIGGTDRYIPFW